MICPNCQKDQKMGAETCPACGFILHSDTAKAIPKQSSVNPSSKSNQEKPMVEDVKITKIAKSDMKAKLTRVHAAAEAPPTKIAKTYTSQPTKLYGQLDKSKPIFGWLVVTKGLRQWQQFVIPKEDCRYIIGSGPEADIRFEDDGVEPVHASLRMVRGKISVVDLDTSAGTLVEGKKVTRKTISDGDQIKIGSVEIKFRKF